MENCKEEAAVLSNKTSVFRIIAAILAVAVAAISLELFIINIIFNRGSDTLQNNDLVYCRLMHEGNPFEYSFDQYTKMESDLKEIGNYYEIYFQYLETGEHADQQLYNMDTKRLDTTEKAVSSIQVEDKVISNCKLKTAEGRLFEPRDYVVEKDQQYFPVILGNVYRNTYKVGDIIQLYYLYSDLKFKVVGILQPDQSQMLGDVFCDFDTSIILPMFKVAEEAPAYFDKKGLLIHYSFLVSGISEIEGENFSDEISQMKDCIANSPCGEISYSVHPWKFYIQDKTNIGIKSWFAILTALFLAGTVAYILVYYRELEDRDGLERIRLLAVTSIASILLILAAYVFIAFQGIRMNIFRLIAFIIVVSLSANVIATILRKAKASS